MKRITGLDWPLLSLAACLLVLSVVGAFWITHFDDGNAGVIPMLQASPYALAAWLVVSGRADGADSTQALATILIVGLVMRLVLMPGWPVSTDLYRYVWDGRVQGAGINPYLHVPADAVLAGLRDDAIYPYINRPDYAPTIYPPMSQIVFYLVTRISEAELAIKAAMVAFEGLAVWTILQLLAARGLPRSRVLLYGYLEDRHALNEVDVEEVARDLAQESSRVLPPTTSGSATPTSVPADHDRLAERIAALEAQLTAQDRTIRKLLKMAAAFLDSETP